MTNALTHQTDDVTNAHSTDDVTNAHSTDDVTNALAHRRLSCSGHMPPVRQNKYVENIMNNPTDEKFRSINMENAGAPMRALLH